MAGPLIKHFCFAAVLAAVLVVLAVLHVDRKGGGRTADHAPIDTLIPSPELLEREGQHYSAVDDVESSEKRDMTRFPSGANTREAEYQAEASSEALEDVEALGALEGGIHASQSASPSVAIDSGDWVREFADVCETPLRRCSRTLPLAISVANASDTGDAWAFRMEEAIAAFVNRVARKEAIAYHEVLCSEEGCLLFVHGKDDELFLEHTPSGVKPLRAYRFLGSMRDEPWTAQMAWPEQPRNGRGGYPGDLWQQVSGDHLQVLYVFERQ